MRLNELDLGHRIYVIASDQRSGRWLNSAPGGARCGVQRDTARQNCIKPCSDVLSYALDWATRLSRPSFSKG